MAERPTAERKNAKKSRAKPRDDTERDAAAGGDGEPAIDEQELAGYLQERIKPGLNRGSIPLLARSIARAIARDQYHREEEEDEAQEDGASEDDGGADLEADLHTLQQRLGEDWIVLYAVNDGQAWLVAETTDATQRLEAPSADVLVKAVQLLEQGGADGSESEGDGESD